MGALPNPLPAFWNPALELGDATIVNDRVYSYYGITYEQLTTYVPANDYGINWPPGTPQYHKECYAYLQGGLDGHEKWHHMINMIRLDLPDFEFTSKGFINTEAIRVIRACCMHLDLGVAGAASSGKTFPIAAYILEDWKAAANRTLSFVCTTTMEASDDRIWGAIVKLFRGSVHKIGTYVQYRHMIVYGAFNAEAKDREISSAIKALAIPRGKEGEEAIATTRGRKQQRIRLVFDELPEMGLYVLRAAVNLEANDELQVIGIGNPANHLDAHGQMLQPKDPRGFESINSQTPEWETRTGYAIFLNGEWSANFQSLTIIPFRYLIHRVKLDRMLKRCHGDKNALDYFRNAIGFWPDATIGITVLTLEDLRMHKVEEKVKWRQTKRIKIAGFDTSFTIGGDLCVLHLGELGEDMNGRQLVESLGEQVYNVPATGVFEEVLAKMVVKDLIRYGVEPDGFGMDISSDGGKVMRAIIKEWLNYNKNAADIVPISSLEKPTERLVSNVDPRKCCDAFDRRVTEYWMMVRETVLCENIKGLKLYVNESVNPMINQLCTRTYDIRGHKFCIETKTDMKARMLGESPDRADAFAYMLEMARRHGLVLKSPEDEKREEKGDAVTWASLYHNKDTDYKSDDWGENDD